MKNNESILLKCTSGTKKRRGREGKKNHKAKKEKRRKRPTVSHLLSMSRRRWDEIEDAGRVPLSRLNITLYSVDAINSLEKCAIRLLASGAACPWITYQLRAQFATDWWRIHVLCRVVSRREARENLSLSLCLSFPLVWVHCIENGSRFPGMIKIIASTLSRITSARWLDTFSVSLRAVSSLRLHAAFDYIWEFTLTWGW